MDLLSQYRQEHPESFQEKQAWTPPRDYGFFIRLAMRLSGGRIRDVNTASYALAIVAGVILIVSLFLFFGIPGVGSTTNLSVPVETKGPLPR